MALINVAVSTGHGSTIAIKWSPDNPNLLAVDLNTNLKSDYEGAQPFVYDRNSVYFHGTPADLRLLAEQIAQALHALSEIDWDLLGLPNEQEAKAGL